MSFVLCYTKPGVGVYDPTNYPEHTAALNCDWEHAMHLAVSSNGENYTPLRNNTGVLFPRCTFTEGKPQGTTKTLLDPWLFRMEDGSFGVTAVRRNQNAPDPLSVGCLMLFTSKDLVRYEEAGFLKLSDGEIRHPRCRFDGEKKAYYLEWETSEGVFSGTTRFFKAVHDVSPCTAPTFSPAPDHGIEGAVPGNVLEITPDEERVLRMHLDVIRHVGVDPLSLTVPAGESPELKDLPWAVCRYSDGSTHEKKVRWDEDALRAVDFKKPGVYSVPGEITQKHWPFPLELSPAPGGAHRRPQGQMSDPCILHYNGKYYLTSSGGYKIVMRVSDTLEKVFQAEPIVIYEVPEGKEYGTWAAELHIIHGVPYLFTSLCPGDWTRVQSCILRCNGAPEDPAAWEAPRMVLKPNGRILTEGGISLDMTYFCVEGVHYVMWSDRKIDHDKVPMAIEPADIYIATVDPSAPWQLTTEPQCVLRPIYGWDRYETEVDEGPYLLRRGDDLFVTISGSSTGMADLYDLGLMHAKVGNNLLTMEGWDWLPYPLLTKESVENQYGPGHNNFVKDPDTGDDLMVYHAVPHDGQGKALGRRPGIRRVHWAASGYPYLEMTEERDLDPALKSVVLEITVK